MFFLTRERQEVFNAAYTYPFGEEFDAEFEDQSIGVCAFNIIFALGEESRISLMMRYVKPM